MIEFLDGDAAQPEVTNEVEFVGGPRSGDRIFTSDRPETIPSAGGAYRRGVACAEDGVQRYVWQPASELTPDWFEEHADEPR